nr:transposase [Metallosphaera sedula]
MERTERQGLDPAYTSQSCSRCGYKTELSLSDRVISGNDLP